MKRLLYILFLTLLFPFAVGAQTEVESESVRVYFRQGSAKLERDYLGNGEALDALAERLGQCGFDDTKGIGRVRISSSVSPEGSNSVNDKLIKARAKSISDWVSKYFDVEVGYIVDSMGVDWVALQELVEASDDVPYKSEVLDILRNTPETKTTNGKVVNTRQNALVRLRGGVPYKHIYRYIFPKLRYAAAYTEIWYAPLITVTSPKELKFSALGGDDTISYTQEEGDKAQPNVNCKADWVSIVKHEGGNITFHVKPNTVATSRTTEIEIEHYDNANIIVIQQNAAEPSLNFTSAVPVVVDAIGGRNAISFNTNTHDNVIPTVACKDNWISNIKATSNRISFSVAPNTIAEPRSSVITIEALGKIYNVAINQTAAASMDVSAVKGGDAVQSPQLVLDRTETVRIYFRQGSAKLEAGYMNNSAALKELAELLEPYLLEDSSQKGHVRISSSVSPEGSNSINDRLVKARARAISNWISQRFNVEIGFIVDSMGVDWETLITMVEEDDNVPNKEEVLDILYNTPEKVTRKGSVVNERENQLKKLRKGVPYRYIYTKIYPKLRYAAAYTEIWYASELTITTPSPINVAKQGGQVSVEFQKNVDDKVVPKTTVRADWINILEASHNNTLLEVAPNNSADQRSANIYVECYGTTQHITLLQQPSSPVWSLNETLQHFPAEGGNASVTYKTNTAKEVSPTYSCNAPWITNIQVSQQDISYQVLPNNVAEARKDSITLSCFGQNKTIVVKQEGSEPKLVITTPTPRNFTAKGGQDVVHFQSNDPQKVTPIVTTTAAWISNLTASQDNISYSVEENLLAAPRNAVISLECYGNNYEVEVCQQAAKHSWRLSQADNHFTAEGGSGIVYFSTNSTEEVTPNTSSKAEWINNIQATSSQVTYQVAPNSVAAPRVDTLILTCFEQPLKVVISQEAAAATFQISDSTTREFTAEGGGDTVPFKTNTPQKVTPSVATSATWIKDLAASQDNISYSVARNRRTEPREAVIIAETLGLTQEIIVKQEGAPAAWKIVESGNNHFPAEGGSGFVNYKTNTSEETIAQGQSQAEWINNIQSSSSQVTYQVAPNSVAAPRVDTLILTCFEQPLKVVISQEAAKEELTFLTPSPRNFTAEGGSDTLLFETNTLEKVIPTVATEAEWIKDLAASQENISYSVARNRKKEPREAIISAECFNITNQIVVTQEAKPECQNPWYASVKTNALYDVMLIPNIGAELYLGHNLSAAANWHYAWWKSDKIKWYWRTYGGDISLRYWFGKAAHQKPLTGHHIGPYGQIITYDFELGKKGILADRWSWSAGVEYGYSLPLAKQLNLDLTLGVGYHTGTFYEYLPIDTHYVWQATKKRNYIGPTKAEVSLVWLFGCKNFNQMKGE